MSKFKLWLGVTMITTTVPLGIWLTGTPAKVLIGFIGIIALLLFGWLIATSSLEE